MKKRVKEAEVTARRCGRPRPGRASWCGQLQLDRLMVPVKAFPAVQSSAGTQLCQVHAGCGCRIEQPRRCPKHGVLEPREIGKAFAYSADEMVELNASDLQSISPVDDKKIVLVQFISATSLDLTLLAGRSLQLAPSHAAADPLYATIVAALTKTTQWGVGTVVFSGKRNLIVVRPESSRLVLHTLHSPRLLYAPVDTVNPANSVSRQTVTRICKTIERNSGSIDWDDFEDDSEDRLMELVRAHVHRPTSVKEPPKCPARKKSRSHPRRRTASRTAKAA
ncbi:MAG: hypothetical protein QGG71_24265 [Pirellulaceae bacterium]|nr:hypothetical protein [Pirellulaceae bacterium]